MEIAPPTPRRAPSAADFGLAAEADAFVSAILHGPGSSQIDDRRCPPTGRATAEDSHPGFHVQEKRRMGSNESVPAAPGRQ
jgi:hypothetical protein